MKEVDAKYKMLKKKSLEPIKYNIAIWTILISLFISLLAMVLS